MPSIVSFHRNVGHAVILIILFSFFYLATPVCRFIHLLSETTLYMWTVNAGFQQSSSIIFLKKRNIFTKM